MSIIVKRPAEARPLGQLTCVALLAISLSGCGGSGSGSTSPSSSSQGSTPPSGNNGSTGTSTRSTSSTYTVGGNVYDLIGGALVLQDNGGDNVTVTASGSASYPFTFSTGIATGQTYSVTVGTQPSSPAQNCVVSQEASGTIASANVTGVEVDCWPVPTLKITEYPAANVSPWLAIGHDGNLWAMTGASASGSGGTVTTVLDQISTNGSITTVPVQGSLANVESSTPVIAGSDGNLWTSVTTIDSVSLTGQSAALSLSGEPLVFDGSGNLWYAGASGAVGSITPSGTPVITTSYSSNITAMALGADGRTWFTSSNANVIGVISPQNGQISTWTLPLHSDNVSPDGQQEGSAPGGIALGSDGNMWFVEQATTKRVGMITPSGTISEWVVNDQGVGSAMGPNIAVGPDGNMWFTILGSEIGYITPAGQVSVSTVPSDQSPYGITTGPDGRMWFTEPTTAGDAVGKVGAVSEPFSNPSNDNFENAATLSGSSGFLYSNNVNATAEPGEPATNGITPEKTLWWQWTAPSTGTLVLSTYGSSYETILGVYTGSALASLTSVGAAHEEGSGLTSVSVAVTAGTTYDIVVDGYNGASGVLLVNWQMQ